MGFDPMIDASAPVVRSWLEALDASLRANHYFGPDPYDALASNRLRRLRSARSRQAAIQLNKRSPIDLRPVLGVPSLRMVKTLALIASSLRTASWLDDAEQRRCDLVDELWRRRNVDGGWGYEFDIQMRWGGYPAGESNIIATYFAVMALMPEIPEDDRRSIARFIEVNLGRDDFIAYAQPSRALIHNANVLGAHALDLLVPGHELARVALETTVHRQRNDGTWPYGDSVSTSWADSFHTAYVLRGMLGLVDATPNFSGSLRRGIEAWLEFGFESDGTPRYFLRPGRQPQDVHNVATVLSTLCHIEPLLPDAGEKIPGVLRELNKFRRSDGTFSTRRRGPAYMRWESAHVHNALADTYAWMSR